MRFLFKLILFPVLCLFFPGGMDANRMNLGICWILSGDLHLGVVPASQMNTLNGIHGKNVHRIF